MSNLREPSRRAAALAALHATTLALVNRHELAGLLDEIVSRAAALLEAPQGFLYLETRDGSRIERKVWIGTRPMDTSLAPGEGVAGKVWRSGQPLMVEDYDTWEGRAPGLAGGLHGAVAGVPLESAGRATGALGVAHDAGSGRTFDEEDLQLLASFAHLASLAIENARVFEAEHAAREQAERLLGAARALSVTMGLQEVLAAILTELQRVVPYDSATVQGLSGQRLEILGGHGFPDVASVLGLAFDLASGDYPNLAAVVRTREPLVLADAWNTHAGFRQEPHAQASIRSWLGVPLLFGDRLTGMLTLDMREPGVYTAEHARLAQAFAAQAAIAVENARLYSAAQAEIAERKRAEQLREDLTHTIVHDLRSPLTATMGFLEMLQLQPGSLPAGQAELLEIATRGARKALQLIDEILDVSRLESGALPLERAAVSMRRLVAEVLELQMPLARERGIALQEDVPSTLTPAWADPDLVSRVVQNLVGNALKFTPARGTVRVLGGPDPEDSGRLRISVCDSGPGIPPEVRGRLFEKFVTGRQQRGSGIGLSFCRLAVEAHGGRIWEENGAQGGAVFVFTLPAAGPADPR
jgi:signal transduction histidine kinase